MLGKGVSVSGLALLLCACVLADVTVRQSVTMKFPPFVPAEMQKQWQQQAEIVLRLKGDKARVAIGPLETMTDYAHNEVTLLDPKTKRFAAVPLSELGGRLAAALKIGTPSGLRLNFQTKKTGRVEVIRSIRAEESLMEITIDLPLMTQALVGPVFADASTVRVQMRTWVAPAGEIRRVPSLKELADYAERSKRALDFADLVQEVLPTVPGIEQLEPAGGLTLKSSTGIYLPAITQLLQLAPEGVPAGIDPNGPLAESLLDLTDITTEPLSDSEFAVPSDYQRAPFEELVRGMIQTPVALPSAVIPDR